MKKKQKWMIAGATALVLVVGGNVVVSQINKNTSSVVEGMQFESVKERTVSSTKLVSGVVVPGNIESIFADATKGKVKEVFVKEGDEVKKGQQLFSYENTEISLQIKQAELEKKSLAMKVEQTKNKLAELKKSNAPADAMQELEFQQKSTDLEVEKNKLQMQELQQKQKDLIVYSHTDGYVQKLDKDATQGGGQLGQAKVFMKVASKDPFQVQGTLTELQKGQIQKDQAVTVTAKAINNKKWTGKIVEISEYPTSAEGGTVGGEAQPQTISSYAYRVALDAQEGLVPGYHVSLQVNLSEKKMLAVLKSSIVEEGGTSYVFLDDKGKLRKQKVTTGLTDGDWIEITEGVTNGQRVVKNPSPSTKEGTDVKENGGK